MKNVLKILLCSFCFLCAIEVNVLLAQVNSSYTSPGIRKSLHLSVLRDQRILPSIEKTKYFLIDKLDKSQRDLFKRSLWQKATMLTYQAWDGIDWQNQQQIVIRYNANDDLEENYINIWNGTDWEYYYRTIYDYDSGGLLSSETQQDYQNSNWRYLSRTVYYYNQSDSLFESVYQINMNNVWVDVSRTVISYDNSNRRIMQEDENYDASTSTWYPYRRTLFTYDVNSGFVNSETIQIWNGSDWDNTEMHTITCDVNGRRTYWRKDVWDGSNWVGVDLYLSQYNAAGELIEQIYEYYDGSVWVVSDKYTAIFDQAGNLTDEHTYTWNGSNWEEYKTVVYTYSGGFLQYYVTSQYDSSSGGFVNVEMKEYVYDNQNRVAFETTKKWHDASSSFENDTRVCISYYDNTGIDDDLIKKTPSSFSIINYPNPFNPSTTIIYNLPATSEVTVAVFNVQGKLIKELIKGEKREPGSYSVIWNGTDNTDRSVPSSVYLYKIKTKDIVKTGKCLLIK